MIAVLSIQLNLNVVRIGILPVPIPPIKEQREITTFLDSKCKEITRLRDNLNAQVACLKQYRKLLIHECVTGKRRIE